MAEEPKGWFDDDLVANYLIEDPKATLFKDVDLAYNRPEPARLQTLAARGGKAHFSPFSLGQRLFLDVGCWTGNGHKSAANHERHREFGVVCGNTAFLCAYLAGVDDTYNGQVPLAEGTLKGLGNIYKELVSPLLRVLSSNPILGKAVVLSALDVHDQDIIKSGKIDTKTLHVFLGDLHLPIVASPAESELEPSVDGVTGRETFRRAGRLRLDSAAMQQINEAAALASQIVELGQTALKGALASFLDVRPAPLPPGDGLRRIWEASNGLRQIRDLILYKHQALMRLLQDIAETQKVEDTFPFNEEPMGRQELDRWFTFYHGDPNAGTKGADIFQGAGKDLLVFLDLLRKYAVAHPSQKVNFVQVGDAYDFWIGMKRGIKGATESGLGVKLEPGGAEFARFWKKRTHLSAVSGPVLKAIDDLVTKPPKNLTATLLYGNHDDFLRHIDPSFKEFYESGVVYAEHGHQSDSFNSDDDPVSGWALTQVAFLIPKIREIEDKLSMTLALGMRLFGNDPGARLQRIARGADVCLERNRLIYVCGHTHRCMLKRVTLRPLLNPMEWREQGVRYVWERMEILLARTQTLLDVELGDEKRDGELPGLVKEMNSTVVQAEKITNELSSTALGSKGEAGRLLAEFDKYIEMAEQDIQGLTKRRREMLKAELDDLKKRRRAAEKGAGERENNIKERYRLMAALIRGPSSADSLRRIEAVWKTVTDPSEKRILRQRLEPVIIGVGDIGYRARIRATLTTPSAWDFLRQ
jgi:hypothetical protein